MRRLKFLLLATAAALFSSSGCVRSLRDSAPIAHSGGQVLIPRLDGTPWTIAGDPDLGEFTSPKQQPVDFAVWPAADGTWQLWSCIRATKFGGTGRLFHRWEGKQLTGPNWKPMGIAYLLPSLKGIQLARLAWEPPIPSPRP
jgi:hypothetical protein